MSVITITVSIASLTTKVKTHLSVIGKRAKDATGKPLYSDLSTSTAEDAVLWKDLMANGSENVVAALDQLSGSYHIENDTITFKVMSERWKDFSADNEHDLTEALHDAIVKFLWQYTLLHFLSIIHPAESPKGAPFFAATYERACESTLGAIRNLAYLKRPPIQSDKDYSNVTGEVVEPGAIGGGTRP